MRIRCDGMAITQATGKLRGRKPKLSGSQEEYLVQLHFTGVHATSEITEPFGVARSTVHRALQRAGPTIWMGRAWSSRRSGSSSPTSSCGVRAAGVRRGRREGTLRGGDTASVLSGALERSSSDT